jgi:phage repressor protein C with HTH and peptisase S24 domain
MPSLGERLKARRTELGLSQAELAASAGMSQQGVVSIEGGDVQRPRRLIELAEVLQVSVDWLLNGTGKPGAARPGDRAPASVRLAPETDQIALGTKDVPIMGTSVGGRDGEFYLNGETLDYARRLPGISRNKNVFGVHVEGDSMTPKFEAGELVYASPGRPPAPGDYIIVELTPTSGERAGPAYIKRLVRRTGNRLVCEQFNPAGSVEYDAREVKAIYRIIPLAELAGF